jgi:hypothetical protein
MKDTLQFFFHKINIDIDFKNTVKKKSLGRKEKNQNNQNARQTDGFFFYND